MGDPQLKSILEALMTLVIDILNAETIAPQTAVAGFHDPSHTTRRRNYDRSLRGPAGTLK